MRRWRAILTLALGTLLALLALGAARPVLAQDGHGAMSPAAQTLRRCAGRRSTPSSARRVTGHRAKRLGAGAAFAAIDAAALAGDGARQAILEGAGSADSGAAMPPYGQVLSEAQVDDLLAYIGTWATGETPPLPEPNIGHLPERVEGFAGDPAAGAAVYARSCAGCHGAGGAGRDAPAFPRLDGEASQIVRVARQGHESPFMPAFSVGQGGPLSDDQLADLEAYLATWAGHEAPQEPDDSRGYSLLIVVAGAVAILLLGVTYMARLVVKEEA
ncbi:MAG: c-type cytochrome [Anaerolineae bacterium]|nr:c-type cytochrome [Anaerolineae bacterium]